MSDSSTYLECATTNSNERITLPLEINNVALLCAQTLFRCEQQLNDISRQKVEDAIDSMIDVIQKTQSVYLTLLPHKLRELDQARQQQPRDPDLEVLLEEKITLTNTEMQSFLAKIPELQQIKKKCEDPNWEPSAVLLAELFGAEYNE